MDPLLAALSLVAGFAAGVVSGLFGVGGGIVMVPVLHYALGLPFALSTQVSLLVIAVNTPLGLLRQHRGHGTVRWQHGALLALGGVAGVLLAAALRPYLSIATLKIFFALAALFAAYRMVRPVAVRPHEASALWLVPAGVVAGAAAHWLGIGGGLLMVPALVFLGTSIHQAVATSLVAVWTNAAFSTLLDLPGLVHHLLDALPLVLGAVFGIVLGVHLANRSPAPGLKRGFAVFLGLMALYVLIDAVGP